MLCFAPVSVFSVSDTFGYGICSVSAPKYLICAGAKYPKKAEIPQKGAEIKKKRKKIKMFVRLLKTQAKT